MITQTTLVQREARQHHRYNSQSNNLERSVTKKVPSSGTSGLVYLEDGIAKYGKYIHEGWHSRKGKRVKGWRADRFLDKALIKRGRDIVIGISAAIDRAIKKAGLE